MIRNVSVAALILTDSLFLLVALFGFYASVKWNLGIYFFLASYLGAGLVGLFGRRSFKEDKRPLFALEYLNFAASFVGAFLSEFVNFMAYRSGIATWPEFLTHNIFFGVFVLVVLAVKRLLGPAALDARSRAGEEQTPDQAGVD